jgi:hypothetical protein
MVYFILSHCSFFCSPNLVWNNFLSFSTQTLLHVHDCIGLHRIDKVSSSIFIVLLTLSFEILFNFFFKNGTYSLNYQYQFSIALFNKFLHIYLLLLSIILPRFDFTIYIPILRAKIFLLNVLFCCSPSF